MMTLLTRSEIEDFYFHEAALLDDRDFKAWLALMAPTVRYWSPVREDIDPAEEDFTQKHRLTHFDEIQPMLDMRVRRMLGDFVHSDTPRGRFRHFITNVRILSQDESSVNVASNFLVFKSRLDEERLISGRRVDKLMRTAEGLKVADRCIIFDHSSLASITTLF